MASDKSFHDYVMADLFRNISGVTSRAMFGGWGIYNEGVFFAIIVDGELYFKVDAAIAPITKKAAVILSCTGRTKSP